MLINYFNEPPPFTLALKKGQNAYNTLGVRIQTSSTLIVVRFNSRIHLWQEWNECVKREIFFGAENVKFHYVYTGNNLKDGSRY